MTYLFFFPSPFPLSPFPPPLLLWCLRLANSNFRYLCAGTINLINRYYITSLPNIAPINNYGILKIKKNILALQQTLPPIFVQGRERFFDQIRNYYELLKLSPKVSLTSPFPSFCSPEAYL